MSVETMSVELARIGLETEREKNRANLKALSSVFVSLLLVPWRIWALLVLVGTLRPLIEAAASWLLRH